MKVCIVGASGFVGGELLRLLLMHDGVEVVCATSRRFKGEYVYRVHPNLRGITKLKFVEPKIDEVLKADATFLALPHGKSVEWVPKLYEVGQLVVDLTADYRLKNPDDYVRWYGWSSPHPHPDLLNKAVYGLPEIHREELRNAKLIAVPGCMATAAILMLAPLVREKLVSLRRIVVDAMIGSSGAGSSGGILDVHGHRTYVVRPYEPAEHRHIAEIEQELSMLAGEDVKVAFTPHAIDLVRGIFTTGHCFSDVELNEQILWRVYREFYSNSPFVRIVRDKSGLQRYPNVKYVLGTNYADIGFELDRRLSRVITFAAIDNLVRGAAGQAVQAFNIAAGYPEDLGLRLIPVHPL